MPIQKDLAEKMLARADRDGLPPEHEMRTTAEAFASALKGFFATPQTCAVKAFFSRWATARGVWCRYTGEPLL